MLSLTAAEVRAVLHYDPVTGIFTWRYRPDRRPEWNTRYAGKEAGAIKHGGSPDLRYRVIRLNDVLYRAHRLAWLYVKGSWPPGDIDHEDGDGLHNWWTNLRPADTSQNAANASMRSDNVSGFKGVSFDTRSQKYRAQIQHRGIRHELGLHDTPELAHAAYVKASVRLNGEFARAG